MRGAFLVGPKGHERLSFHPYMTGLVASRDVAGHAPAIQCSLMTAPLMHGSVMREVHTFNGVLDVMTIITNVSDQCSPWHAFLQPRHDLF